MLSHPNGWQRDTAARLLHERRDPKSVALLASTLATSRVPLARLHALHALAGMGVLNATHVLTGLRDRDARVREHAVRVSEKLVQGGVLPDAVWNQLRQMSADLAPRVRYQLAFTLGEAPRRGSDQALAALIFRDPNDLWMQAAVFSSLGQGAGDLFVLLARDARVRRDPVGREWLRRQAAMIGVRGFEPEVVQVMDVAQQLGTEPMLAFTLLHALGEGLGRAGSSLAAVDRDGRLLPWYDEARTTVLKNTVAEPPRITAMQLISVSPYPFSNAGDVLLLQVGSGQSEAIQSAALAALGRFDDPRILPGLTARWSALTPRLRGDAFGALLARANRAAAVLEAIGNGRLDSADLTPTQRNFLRTHHDPEIRQRALQLLGPVPGRRPDAVQRFKPTLGLKGAATRGRDIYLARCAGCHQRGPAGQALGPDLGSARIYGKEKLLAAILEPNAEVRREDVAYVVQTVEGECRVGLLRGENPTTITLLPLGSEPLVFPRGNLQYLEAQPWSLMPGGLEEGLTAQDMADLLNYVLSAAP
jgi:putative heme-binding domain-containing protein